MEVTVIRQKRKTVSIRVNSDLTVTVRAPKYASKSEIERIINEKKPWIIKHLKQMEEENIRKASEKVQYLTNYEIKELAERAMEYIPERVRYYADIIGVSYGRITIRNQKTRWGSCSSKGNLNFNCLLMLTPDEIIDYVIVHELCHRIEMNHSKAFWNEVEKILPNYKDYIKWLKNEGGSIMRRMTG